MKYTPIPMMVRPEADQRRHPERGLCTRTVLKSRVESPESPRLPSAKPAKLSPTLPYAMLRKPEETSLPSRSRRGRCLAAKRRLAQLPQREPGAGDERRPHDRRAPRVGRELFDGSGGLGLARRAEDQGHGDRPDHDVQQCHHGKAGPGDDVERRAVRRRLRGVGGVADGRPGLLAGCGFLTGPVASPAVGPATGCAVSCPGGSMPPSLRSGSPAVWSIKFFISVLTIAGSWPVRGRPRRSFPRFELRR